MGTISLGCNGIMCNIPSLKPTRHRHGARGLWRIEDRGVKRVKLEDPRHVGLEVAQLITMSSPTIASVDSNEVHCSHMKRIYGSVPLHSRLSELLNQLAVSYCE